MAGTCLLCFSAAKHALRYITPRVDRSSLRSSELPSPVCEAEQAVAFEQLGVAAFRGCGVRSQRLANGEALGNGGRLSGIISLQKVGNEVQPAYGAPLHRKAAGGYSQGRFLTTRASLRFPSKRGRGANVTRATFGNPLPGSSLVSSLPSTPLYIPPSQRSCTVRSSRSDREAPVETNSEPPTEMPSAPSSERTPNSQTATDSETTSSQAANAATATWPEGTSITSSSQPEVNGGLVEPVSTADASEGPEESLASTSNGGSFSQGRAKGYRRETVLPHVQLREEVRGRRSRTVWRPKKPERKSSIHELVQSHYKNQGGATQDLYNAKYDVTLHLQSVSTGCVTWLMRALDAYPKEAPLDDLLDTMLQEAPVAISDMGNVLKGLMTKRRWRRLLQVLEYLEARNFAVPSFYSIAIDALGRCRQYKEAIALFRSERCPKNTFTYNGIMLTYTRMNNPSGAEAVFQEMRDAGVTVDSRTYNVVIDYYCKRRSGFEKAEELYRQMLAKGISPDRITYSMLISACGRWERNLPEQALAFFRDMKERNVEPDLIVYNALIDTLGKAGMCDEAAAVLDGMEQTTWRPNIVTYTALIDSYSRRGRWEEAAALVERMKAQGPRPNVVTYTCLLNAYGTAKLMDKAEEVFQEMIKEGRHPNIMTWTSLLFHYGQAGMLEEAKDVVMRMEDAGCRPNQASYTALIQAFMKAARYEDVLAVFEAMKEDLVQPDEVAYLCILRALVDSGAPERVPAVYEELLKTNIRPGAKVELVRTEAYFKMNQIEEGKAIFAAIQAPDKIAYDQYIAFLAKAGRSQDAYQALEDMKAKGIEVSHYAYSGVVLAYCNGGGDDGKIRKERILEFLEEMRELEIEPTAAIYNIIINAFSVRNMYSEAEEMYGHMQENKVEPDAVTFETLMGMYCEMHDFKQALGVFRWMKAVGYLPSTYAFFLLVRACELAGSRGARPFIFDILEDHDIKVDVTFVDMLAESLWWHRGRRRTVLDILDSARNVGLYPAVHQENKEEWTLVLDTLSEGTCQGMVLVWLAEIRLAFETKEPAPKRYVVTINTTGLGGGFGKLPIGLGKLPIGLSAVKETLDDMGSPFALAGPAGDDSSSGSRLVAEAPAVQRWLMQPEVKVKLINPEAEPTKT